MPSPASTSRCGICSASGAASPLYRLLGGSPPGTARADLCQPAVVVATSIWSRETPQRGAQRGYRQIKLHELTREAVLAAKAAAADAAIMLDINCPWTLEGRTRWRRLSSKMGWPGWRSRCGHRRTRRPGRLRSVGIPLTAGENTAGVFGFAPDGGRRHRHRAAQRHQDRRHFRVGADHRARPRLWRAGGAALPVFWAGFCRAVHVAAALAERPLVEALWIEMEANPFDPWVRVRDGKVAVPPGAGSAVIPIRRC